MAFKVYSSRGEHDRAVMLDQIRPKGVGDEPRPCADHCEVRLRARRTHPGSGVKWSSGTRDLNPGELLVEHHSSRLVIGSVLAERVGVADHGNGLHHPAEDDIAERGWR